MGIKKGGSEKTNKNAREKDTEEANTTVVIQE